MNKLRLKLTAIFAGQIGYGEVYRCQVLEVLQGELKEKTITITILVADKEYSNFLSSNPSPARIVVGFEENKKNEPYARMPISGMVDTHKTSWLIKEMELAD